MNEKHAALLHRIEMAFANVPRPTKVTKRVARAYDDECVVTEERRKCLYALDSEQHWKELTQKDLASYQDVWTWLDEEGALFYFPAFMVHNLAEVPPFGWMSARGIADVLRKRPEQLRLFNSEQMNCVADFVRLQSEYEEQLFDVCPVCGGPLISEKCKVVCRSERCRYRIIFNCAEF